LIWATQQEPIKDTAPSIYFIVNDGTCRKHHPDVFSHQFRKLAEAAGIPREIQFRDLQATAATKLKDAGADILDMSTDTGRKTVTMARRHARPTSAQFERTAAKRQANKPKSK
jgi:hypothetical protein